MGFTTINSQSQMGTPELSSRAEFPTTRLLPTPNNDTEFDGDFSLTGFQSFDGSGGTQLLSRAKPLRPLYVFPHVGPINWGIWRFRGPPPPLPLAPPPPREEDSVEKDVEGLGFFWCQEQRWAQCCPQSNSPCCCFHFYCCCC
ncbi:unnamed protein product [Prunus armeniaca]